MERIRLDDIRSICYSLGEREFKFTVDQSVGHFTIHKIEEDLPHLTMTNKLRYIIHAYNGNEIKPWKIIPADSRCVIIEQFI